MTIEFFTKNYWRKEALVIRRTWTWYLLLIVTAVVSVSQVVNAGRIEIRAPGFFFVFYFGVGPFFWGILLTIVAGLWISKARGTEATLKQTNPPTGPQLCQADCCPDGCQCGDCRFCGGPS